MGNGNINFHVIVSCCLMVSWICPCSYNMLFSLQEGFAFAHCTTCKAPYYLRVHALADRKWRTLKFRFFVTRDILFIFLAVQLVGHLLSASVFFFFFFIYFKYMLFLTSDGFLSDNCLTCIFSLYG